MAPLAPEKLLDFFRYFDADNENHRRAALLLAGVIPPEEMDDSAEWVKTFRKKPEPPPVPTVTDWYDWNSKVSRYFTVGEAFQWDPYRRDRASSEVKANILKVARKLDELRDRFGPLGVTSWYRDPDTNRRVGGVSNSQHLQGHGVDVYPLQYDGREFEKWCEANWNGGVGRGQSSGRGFTHLDLGAPRVWDY